MPVPSMHCTSCGAAFDGRVRRGQPLAFVVMTPAEVAITAALGASLLTGGASLGVVWVQQALRNKADSQSALESAVLELLSRSMAVAMRARTMGEAMKTRSGLGEGVDVALRIRKPLDHMEFHDWLAKDTMPLSAALDQIWARWDQEGVRLANDVVGKCMDLVGASTATQPVRSGWERVRKWAVGERWTPEMLAAHERAMKDLAHARKRLADYARTKLGLEAVDLFAQAEQPAEPLAVDGPADSTGQQELPSIGEAANGGQRAKRGS